MEKPIFIIGSQRSGTTLLCSILNRHPDTYVTNELPWETYEYIRGTRRNLAGMVALLARHQKVADLAARVERIENATPFDVLEAALEGRAELLGKRRWGIKHPRLTYFFPAFIERYRDGRAILLVRDCRATALSNMKQKYNVANIFKGATLWRAEVEMQLDLTERYAEKIRLVRYEDLVRDPRPNLESICEFLEISFTEELLDADRGTDIHVHSGNVNITRPIDPKIAEKWKQQLTPRQCGIIDAIAGEYLERFGYELTGERTRVSLPERWFYELHQFVLTNYWWQKRSRLSGLRRRVRGVFAREAR